MMNREVVYERISEEREYQKKKWGKYGECHEVGTWISYIDHYLQEAKKAISEYTALDAIRKLTALGVACMEDKGAPKRWEGTS